MKKPSRRNRRSEISGDIGTPERRRHDLVVIENVDTAGSAPRPRARVYSRNPLETYLKRRLIDEKQKLAGELLGRLWHLAGVEPRLVARYEEYVDVGRAEGFAVRRSEAYQRWRRAVAAVGPVAAEEVISVCCEERAVGGAIRMEILRRGLEVLAKHFGLRMS